jgi:hypothetical protein
MPGIRTPTARTAERLRGAAGQTHGTGYVWRILPRTGFGPELSTTHPPFPHTKS